MSEKISLDSSESTCKNLAGCNRWKCEFRTIVPAGKNFK